MKLDRKNIILVITVVILLGIISSRRISNFIGFGKNTDPTPLPTTLIPLTATPAPTLSPTETTTGSPQQITADWYVSPDGSDSNAGTSQDLSLQTIQKAIDSANSGDTILLASGTYMQDFISKRNGTSNAPITITGPSDAVVKGGGNARIIQIQHDYITLRGFTVDGLYGEPNSIDGYRDKLVYVQGSQDHDGVTGLRVLYMTIKNAGGECMRLRYFVTQSEIAYNTITSCGHFDYSFDDGGKNGEGVYIGTAPEQRNDGKNPTSDTDESNVNLIHNNTIDTQGNECVDIKEDSKYNIVEYNSCTGQKDTDSGGMDSRGGYNIFRYNEIFGNAGAGVRLGGDTVDQNINNDVYNNIIRDNENGGIKFQAAPQGEICGNTMSNNTKGNAVGEYGEEFDPAAECKK